jgi:flagellar assembly protein FliH
MLLYNIIKCGYLTRKSSIKPHSFQEIGVEYSQKIRCKTGKDKIFQRVELVKNNKSSSSSPKESTGNEKTIEEMEKTIEEMKKTTQTVEKQAFDQGFEKGKKAGMESEAQKIETILSDFHRALLDLEKVEKKIYLNAEKETLNLSLAIAEKIVCHEVGINKEVVLNVIKEAFKKVVDHEKIKIKISPSDLRFMEKSEFQFFKIVDDMHRVVFEEHKNISDGGCIIETDWGNIDARIEKQLQVVEEAFKAELP